MLSKAHQSSRACGGARALVLAISLAAVGLLACGGSAYAVGLSAITRPAAAAQSEQGALSAEGAAVQPPAAAVASATSAVAQSAGTIVPGSGSHTSGPAPHTAARAAAQATAAAATASSTGGHAASKLLTSARSSAPAASEVVARVSRAVSRTLAPVAAGARVLKAPPLTAAQRVARALVAGSRRGGGHVAAAGREAIMRVLGPATPAAAAAIQGAAEALAGARGRSRSLPLPGLGDLPIPAPVLALVALAHHPAAGAPERSVVEALGAYLGATAPGRGAETIGGGQGAGAAGPGRFDLATVAALGPAREVFSPAVWASRTPCTLAGAEAQITQRCVAAPLPVLGRGSRPLVAGAAAPPSRGPPVQNHLGGAHASARSAAASDAPGPQTGSGGPAGSAAGALGSAFPTLLLLVGLLLAGIPRLTRLLSLARQCCIAAPLALTPERPG